MSKLQSLKTYITDKKARDYKLLELFGKLLDDEAYLKRIYKISTGRDLNLNNPQTYTEKLQWLKLYDRNPQYTLMQDKYEVRKIVAERIGEEYLVPLLGVWNCAEDIDFDKLPEQFVLKCNHDCASVIICRDKTSIDITGVKEKLNACLSRNYYENGREWAYKDIKPKIIAEQYLKDGVSSTLPDYKFFCCSGKAKMVLVTSGQAHTPERRTDFFNMSFEHLPIKRGNMSGAEMKFIKPEGFNILIPLAEAIAGDIPFVRVDFYLVNKHPYFGEIAFYPSGGFAEFSPYEWEERIGGWINLPQKQKDLAE